MLQTGHAVDRYVVEEKIGEGGMAVVYRVRHATLGTRHALKVLSITSKDVRDRLIQEGRVQATLRHPNIVAVTDVLDVDGSPGLLMEYIRGPALDHWLFNYRPTLEEALTIFRGIVAGVGHAHGKGLIHRDLKPANVMLHVDETGIHPKVTDFGLAKGGEGRDLKRTRTGTTMGTPAYMAPEQIRDASTVDRRADLYSLGCILYELVCGRTPFGDDDIIELFSRVAAGDYQHPREFVPDVPNNVVECIESLVEVKKELRLTDCASILEVLDGVSRESLTNAIALTGPVDQELAPPRPLPDPGVTTLPLHGPAADMARRFLVQVTTPAPLADRFGSLAPRPPVAAPAPRDPDTGVQPLLGARPRPVASERGRTGVVALAGISGVALAVALLVVAGLGLLSVWAVLAASGPDDAVPTEVVPDPVPAPRPVPPPAPAPVIEAAPEPAPVPAPAPAPAPVKPKPKPGPKPAPKPTPKPAPVQPGPVAPASDTGAVRVTDGSYAVRLVSATGDVLAPGAAVPAGRYAVRADFPGFPDTPAGSITVPAGGAVSLRCRPESLTCKAE